MESSTRHRIASVCARLGRAIVRAARPAALLSGRHAPAAKDQPGREDAPARLSRAEVQVLFEPEFTARGRPRRTSVTPPPDIRDTAS